MTANQSGRHFEAREHQEVMDGIEVTTNGIKHSDVARSDNDFVSLSRS
jgi:hypothetical protein